MMTRGSERRLSGTQSLRVPQPKAGVRSAISRLAKILAVVALATLRILPRIGRIACVLRSRACLAEPPAESPSTMKISVPAGSSAEQSELAGQAQLARRGGGLALDLGFLATAQALLDRKSTRLNSRS